MNPFKKLAKAFTTWRSSSSASSDKQKKHDDYADAMAYLKERMREAEYNEAMRRINPAMTSQAAMNARNAMGMANASILQHNNTGAGMGAVNQAWAPTNPDVRAVNTQQFSVEKVDNGFIIRSGKYTKICNNMEELSAQFVAIMVEKQLDK